MNRERLILAQMYSIQWVAKKTDMQILAIFKRLQSKGVIRV
jgi:hypothetical protein